MAFNGHVENPVNPATGIAVTSVNKQNDEQVVTNINIASDFDAVGNSFFVGSDDEWFVLKNHDWRKTENWSRLE